ncbi:helix-turn-helix domain-containing protein [Ancylobacter terrae]|uniref:helix-turn-helix domain-containing protein n=1 Tax=Ancylobacter sp. sgz301288 TaxID=3342077 RepID=UPI003859E963
MAGRRRAGRQGRSPASASDSRSGTSHPLPADGRRGPRRRTRRGAAQCRAACALLDWSQQQLADAARVGVVTVRQLESGASQPRNATLDVLRRALEAAGVLFIDRTGNGPGVRLEDRA